MVDLIYTDENRVDIGVIQNCQLDLAYGADENDFELTVDKSNHCCTKGSLIYIENTEYGGVVDAIEVSTNDNDVKYLGRTWHGLLNSKYLEPPDNEDYLIVYGDANHILQDFINLMNLGDLFVADTAPSDIYIAAYQVERYAAGYQAMLKMLSSVGAKLKMEFRDNRVVLWAELITDYANNDDEAVQDVPMTVKQYQNRCNHLICLGKGDLKDRKVIHLFTDENGGLQPYTARDNPLKDSHYILDHSQQILFGIDEITEVYDNSSAEVTENYIILTSQPSGWAKKFADYYILNDEDEFENVEGVTKDVITTLTSKPSDWSTNFSSYYIDALTDKTVEGIDNSKYSLLKNKPSNWNVSYDSYYEYYTDGASVEYRAVSGVSYNKYTKQTRRPSDWEENYKSYFYKKKTKYVEVAANAPGWKSKTYYSKSQNKYVLLKKKPGDWSTKYSSYYMKSGSNYIKVEGIAPGWKKQKYYTKSSLTKTPQFVENKYYKQISSSTTAPSFVAGKFQSKTEKTVAPVFVKNKYYQKVLDNFKTLVEGGINKLKEIYSTDELDIELDESHSYDIGDLVGGIEPITNIEAVQTINKKIVKIYQNRITITYETGVLE
ncbi:MAG: hypothetical protein NC397_09270 [Clostridium sp.]|nr:hypothetical protein [Clostridium sp.]